MARLLWPQCVQVPGSFSSDFWLHCALWLCLNQSEPLTAPVWRMCFMFCCFHCKLYIILLLVSRLYVLFEHVFFWAWRTILLCQKESSWHVLVMFPTLFSQCMFCIAVLYCVGSQETYRVKKSFFSRSIAAHNGVKGRTRSLAFSTQTWFAFKNAHMRICRILNSQHPSLRIVWGINI